MGINTNLPSDGSYNINPLNPLDVKPKEQNKTDHVELDAATRQFLEDHPDAKKLLDANPDNWDVAGGKIILDHNKEWNIPKEIWSGAEAAFNEMKNNPNFGRFTEITQDESVIDKARKYMKPFGFK